MHFKPNKYGLLLPEIIHVDDVELVRKKESEEDNDHHRTVSGCRIIFPDIRKTVWRIGYLLPAEYQTLLDKSIFAIDANYSRAIEDLFLNGRHYWGYHLYMGFDTTIRESLLGPAQEFIRCAFDILADCWYDVETRWFSRDYPLKFNLHRLMIYRFWAGQTGRAGQWWNAGFDTLERRLKNHDDGKQVESFRCSDENEIEVIRKMVTNVGECQELQEKTSRNTWTFDTKYQRTFLEEKKMLDNMSAKERKKFEEAKEVIG